MPVGNKTDGKISKRKQANLNQIKMNRAAERERNVNNDNDLSQRNISLTTRDFREVSNLQIQNAAKPFFVALTEENKILQTLSTRLNLQPNNDQGLPLLIDGLLEYSNTIVTALTKLKGIDAENVLARNYLDQFKTLQADTIAARIAFVQNNEKGLAKVTPLIDQITKLAQFYTDVDNELTTRKLNTNAAGAILPIISIRNLSQSVDGGSFTKNPITNSRLALSNYDSRLVTVPVRKIKNLVIQTLGELVVPPKVIEIDYSNIEQADNVIIEHVETMDAPVTYVEKGQEQFLEKFKQDPQSFLNTAQSLQIRQDLDSIPLKTEQPPQPEQQQQMVVPELPQISATSLDRVEFYKGNVVPNIMGMMAYLHNVCDIKTRSVVGFPHLIYSLVRCAAMNWSNSDESLSVFNFPEFDKQIRDYQTVGQSLSTNDPQRFVNSNYNEFEYMKLRFIPLTQVMRTATKVTQPTINNLPWALSQELSFGHLLKYMINYILETDCYAGTILSDVPDTGPKSNSQWPVTVLTILYNSSLPDYDYDKYFWELPWLLRILLINLHRQGTRKPDGSPIFVAENNEINIFQQSDVLCTEILSQGINDVVAFLVSKFGQVSYIPPDPKIVASFSPLVRFNVAINYKTPLNIPIELKLPGILKNTWYPFIQLLGNENLTFISEDQFRVTWYDNGFFTLEKQRAWVFEPAKRYILETQVWESVYDGYVYESGELPKVELSTFSNPKFNLANFFKSLDDRYELYRNTPVTLIEDMSL